MWSVRLPDTVQIAGTALVGAGKILIGTHSPFSLLVLNRRGIQLLPVERTLDGRGLLFAATRRGLALYDPTMDRLLIEEEGQLSPHGASHAGDGPVETTAVDGRWLFLAGPEQDSYWVSVFDLQTDTLVAGFTVSNSDGLPPHSARFALGPGGAYLSFMRYPFTIRHITPQGCNTLFFRMPDVLPTKDNTSSQEYREWISMGLLALDRALILQLADPASDDRLVLLIDPAGRVLRTTTIHAAVGFVAADHLTRTLYAIRSLNVRELVAYRWTWEQ